MKGDAAAVAACYTTNARILPPGSSPLSGAAAIAGYWGQGMQGGIKGIRLTTLEAEQHGDTAIDVGSAELVGDAGAVLDTANYIVIWKRVDGKWKLHRDIWNSNAAAQ